MTQAPSAADVRQSLQHLKPGDGIWFKCEGAQPYNRIFYQRVSAVAYALWGPGTYALRSGKGEVGIIRLPSALTRKPVPKSWWGPVWASVSTRAGHGGSAP